ncbi:DNA-binding transcriptional regulator YhcF (GntR family) [Bradyrhizobium sp. LM2.7]
MDWIPTISELSGPRYQRIVDAMEADIAAGRLVRGQQLPTQRALAKALDVDLTTVTRAYTEARRRGILEARVGQGSFVSETSARRAVDVPHPVAIDLSMNVPPHPLEAQLDERIIAGLEAIRAQSGLTAHLNYQPPGGSAHEREVAARWMRARVPHAHADRLVIYPGAQTILFNLLACLARPGDVVLTEALTFPGIKAAAARLGVKLAGVTMDDGGILPDALAKACRALKPKAVYLIPTLHNPTTATLLPERRSAIAQIIHDAGTTLIEDDAYGLLDPLGVADRQPHSGADVSGDDAVKMHRAGAARRLSCDARQRRAAGDAELSAGHRADAGTADGRAGDALARERHRRSHHHRHPQRSRRPPATRAARAEGLSVPGQAGRASSVAAAARRSPRRRRASVAQWARSRGRR